MWAVIRMRTFRRSTRNAVSRMRKPKPRASAKQRSLERHFGSRQPTKNKFLNAIYWGIRRCQYFLCCYDDEVEDELEDASANPFNTQPPGLDQLVQLTGFNRKWIMFMYRNFKQKCSNGRMTDSQWRILFRSIFPQANDSAFIDRLYAAIVKKKQHPQITFEDLILCLWELSEDGKTSEMGNYHINSSARAQFAFQLMDEEGKGRVDEPGFYKYTRCVFALTAVNKPCTDQIIDASTIGLPASSIYRSTSVDDVLKPMSPLIARFSSKRFKELDTDRDGFITVRDIERELEIQKNEAICLKSLKDFSFEDLKNEEDDDDEDDQDTNPLLSESSSFKKDV
ncbi:EF-hand domain-containing protein [Caenorhabditis elegans]|uniref:EF-hand domain-containing protein n=1 Tax=Caenorhabditis elegans TaxID=6239 RepID=O16638_CAEEL|nr:EF-hand domain-containing protein [Caenorhabditis elegans]CCD73655.1 EF-hand domain-containing protein [Caenorhabditis elegans]|eukprot:NP_494569.1 Neuronal Calcium Sensor family [Caenorhabditis elegans]